MKKLIGLAGLMVLATGCHTVTYTTEKGEVFRATSVLQTLRVGKLEKAEDGSIVVENYGRAGDADLLNAAIQGALQAMATSAAP